MNIEQNKELQALMDTFHRGEIAQSEYRTRRRELLEKIAQDANKGQSVQVDKNTIRMVRTTFWGALIMVALLAGTVAVVKWLL